MPVGVKALNDWRSGSQAAALCQPSCAMVAPKLTQYTVAAASRKTSCWRRRLQSSGTRRTGAQGVCVSPSEYERVLKFLQKLSQSLRSLWRVRPLCQGTVWED